MRLNQRQRAFLDAVTHEMKTPLAALRLYLDTLVRRDPDSVRRKEFLGRMREDLDRLDRTVDQVLAAARAEDRGQRPQLGAVALPRLLEACIDLISPVRLVRTAATLAMDSVLAFMLSETALLRLASLFS